MGTPPPGRDERGADTPEQALIERCQRGDKQAFDALLARYETQVYNLAYRLMGNPDDARDLAQEAFLRMYKALPHFRGGSAFATWLYRIVTNLCLDEMKKRRRRPQLVDEPIGEDDENAEPLVERIADEKASPDEVALSHERQRLVQAAISSLRRHHRAVLVLYDLQGCSYSEIADVLKVSVGTVKSRLNRARLALKEKLEPYRELFD